MTIETAKGTFEARPVTLAERRRLAAHLLALWRYDERGGAEIRDPETMARVAEEARKALDEPSREAFDALPIFDQPFVGVELAQRLAEGVSGKDSGA